MKRLPLFLLLTLSACTRPVTIIQAPDGYPHVEAAFDLYIDFKGRQIYDFKERWFYWVIERDGSQRKVNRLKLKGPDGRAIPLPSRW